MISASREEIIYNINISEEINHNINMSMTLTMIRVCLRKVRRGNVIIVLVLLVLEATVYDISMLEESNYDINTSSGMRNEKYLYAIGNKVWYLYV